MRRAALLSSALTLSFVVSLAAPFSVFADAPSAPGESSLIPQGASAASPQGLSSCFQYYSFGSVAVSFQPSLSQVSPGAEIAFSGTITNKNPYPVEDVGVYAKVFREKTDAKSINGPDVVDWFPIATGMSLKAGESAPLATHWKVPPDALPGSYELVTYVVASDRFNLEGLSFTDDVTGSMSNFIVMGTEGGSVSLDKESVLVNGLPFYFAAFPPTVSAGPVTVVATAKNTTTLPFSGSVSWKLYYWDALQGSHLVSENKSEVKLHPGDSADVSFTASDSAHSVYYLVAELDTAQGSKSLLGVRFVRADVDEPRLNFVGVSAYPGGGNAVAFACAHDTGSVAAASTTITLAASRSGVMSLLGPLLSASWNGDLPGDMQALSAPLPAVSSFNLTASLYQNGKLIDQVTVPYRCAALGASCSLWDTWMPVYLLSIFLGLILIILVLWRKRAEKTARPPSFASPML